ncbi:MAG TPA: VIT domain-containing protein, partial [Abditibacterium sp.]
MNKLFLPLCGLIALAAPAPSFALARLKPTSGVSQALSTKALRIETHLRGAFAQTTLTTTYSNPNNDRMEADFLYSAPAGSVVTGFAYWYRGEKVTARVVEKARAAKIYQYITSRMRDPALVEMVGKNSFRARIFPIEARTDLKIEIKLVQTLPQTQAGPLWSYPLREETAEGPLDFSLRLRAEGNVRSNLGTLKGGRLDIERASFIARDDLRVLRAQNSAPLRASLLAARDGGKDGFFALSLTSDAALSKPDFKISGVPVYDLIYPQTRLKAGQPLLVVGRYRGSGSAMAHLNGRTAKLKFLPLVEKNNLASLLWASSRIENLSASQKNRARVLALSKRFGVPSKWTSWLAIPSEERATFKKQMIASDREGAARAYAQAVARGEAASARAQRQLVANLTAQLLKIDRDYSSKEELQPLPNYLNDELKSLRRARNAAKYGGATLQMRAQWAKWERNLRRAGASDGAPGIEMPVYVLEDEMRMASKLLAMEVEDGRGVGRKARALERRLKELGETKVGREYGWDADTFGEEQAAVRANSLAMEIAVNRLAKTPDAAREKAAQLKLNRLARRFSLDARDQVRQAVQSVGSVQAERLARMVVVEEKIGVQPRKRAELLRFARLLQVKPDDLLKQARTTLVRNEFNSATDALASEILAGREDSPQARSLKERIDALGARSSDTWQKDALNRAYQGRAHQLAFEIERERAKSAPDSARIAALQARLTRVAPLAGTTTNRVLDWEQRRVAAGETSLDIEKYRFRVAGRTPDDYGSGYGGGDPLLAIEAPSDAQVVAIMPDGSVKKLEWRAQTRRWEANFDIPTGTMGGNYFVTLIIVEKNGTRRTLKLRYRVDDRAPQSQIKMSAPGADGGQIHLDLAAEDDVERITALLPWNERL